MADDRRGIRRIIELVLDKASAKRVERETQRALDRGTDPKRPVQNVRRLDRALKGLTATAKNLITVLGAIFGARLVGQAISAVFKLGTTVEETGSKFTVVFREMGDSMTEFLADWGRLAGLTITEGQEIAATAGAIAQGFGFAVEESAEFSQAILRLAGDLQSFHNVPIEETFAALRSGISGETEPLKRFGIILLDADVKARALANSSKRLTSELTQQEIATARLELITERAGVAIGNLEQTQNSTANVTRVLARDLRQIGEEFSFALLPAMSLVIRGWADMEDGMSFAARAARFLGDVITKTVAGLQIIAVRVNAFFRTIPAQFKIFVASTQDILLSWLEGVEQAVNFLRRLAGAQEVDFTSGLRESVERLRSEGTADIVAFRILVEEEIAKIVAASRIAKTEVGDLPSAVTGVPRGAGTGAGATRTGPGASRAFLARGEGFLFGGAERPGFGEARFDFGAGFAGALGGEDFFGFQAARTELELLADEILALPPVFDESAELMKSSMTSAAFAISDAFAVGFEAILSDMSSLPKAAVGIGFGIVAGLAGGMAQYHEAQGVGKFAEGTWPPNPAAVKAAFGHFAAAGLFRALGALASKGQRNLSGGATGGAQSFGALAGRVQTLQNQGGETSTVIFIDPFNPDNPLHRRQVYRGTLLAQQEFGDQIPVDIRRGGPR